MLYQWDAILGQYRMDLFFMFINELIDLLFPCLLAEADCHCNTVIKLDSVFRAHRNDYDLMRLDLLGEVTGNGSPDKGQIDLIADQVLLYDLAWINPCITAHDGIGNGMSHQAMLIKPVGRRALVKYPDPEPALFFQG